MVKKLGKRKRKALAKAKRQKGIKEKFPEDIITKLLYIGQQLKELAEEMEVDYVRIAEDGETGPYYEGTDTVERSGLTTKERLMTRNQEKRVKNFKDKNPSGSLKDNKYQNGD